MNAVTMQGSVMSGVTISSFSCAQPNGSACMV